MSYCRICVNDRCIYMHMCAHHVMCSMCDAYEIIPLFPWYCTSIAHAYRLNHRTRIGGRRPICCRYAMCAEFTERSSSNENWMHSMAFNGYIPYSNNMHLRTHISLSISLHSTCMVTATLSPYETHVVNVLEHTSARRVVEWNVCIWMCVPMWLGRRIYIHIYVACMTMTLLQHHPFYTKAAEKQNQKHSKTVKRSSTNQSNQNKVLGKFMVIWIANLQTENFVRVQHNAVS